MYLNIYHLTPPPKLNELVNISKYIELKNKIEQSNLSKEEKQFLKMSACRHLVFNYSKIADYYASASKEMQQLMEDSALVIIDINDAIANGYVRLSQRINEIIGEKNGKK